MSTEADSWLEKLGVVFEPIVQEVSPPEPPEPPPEPVTAEPVAAQPIATTRAAAEPVVDEFTGFEPVSVETLGVETLGAETVGLDTVTEEVPVDAMAELLAPLPDPQGLVDFIRESAEALEAAAKSVIEMDAPIGVLPLISASPTKSAGQGFSVVVASTDKDGLLQERVISGAPLALVKIVHPGVTATLRNALITFISFQKSGASLAMQIESEPPRDPAKRPTPSKGPRPSQPTLVMGDPVGSLPLVSSSLAKSRKGANVIVKPDGGAAARLFEAISTGRRFANVTIFQKGLRVEMQDVLITSLQTSGDGGEMAMSLDAGRPVEVIPD